MADILLASKSPRRRELFSIITDRFDCTVAPVDESSIRETDAEQLCIALGTLKCRAVAAQQPDAVVVGCDTVVEVDGRILGKPHSKDEAREMLQLLSGRAHNVFTGVCISHQGRESAFAACTGVRFFAIPDEEIEKYINTEEPYDKAGAYGIQGWMARWLEGLDGDYFNVMGLPVSRVYAQLRADGFV